MNDLLEYWYRALRSERGIVIRTDDFEYTRQKLYEARTAVMDPELKKLSLVQSPTDNNELWIVKRPSE